MLIYLFVLQKSPRNGDNSKLRLNKNYKVL